MSQQLNQYNNDWYKPGHKLKILLWYIISLVFFHTQLPFPSRVKRFLLKLFGAKIGRGVVIKPNVHIKYPWKLEIGDYSWIGEKVWLDNLAEIKIGCHCCISQGAYLLTGNHNYKKPSFDLIIGPIFIGDSAWIGAMSTVCPSVIVHDSAVLTVGSIATKNLDEFGIYQGNPAIKIKDRIIEPSII